MTKVIARCFVKPENADAVAPLLKELVEISRKEAGCKEYRVFFESKAPTDYLIIEEWESHEAVSAHISTESFKRIDNAINKLCSQSWQISVLDELVI